MYERLSNKSKFEVFGNITFRLMIERIILCLACQSSVCTLRGDMKTQTQKMSHMFVT